jgi:hypothetical protein
MLVDKADTETFLEFIKEGIELKRPAEGRAGHIRAVFWNFFKFKKDHIKISFRELYFDCRREINFCR